MKLRSVSVGLALLLAGCAGSGTSRTDLGLLTPLAQGQRTSSGEGVGSGGLIAAAGVEISRRERQSALAAEYRALESTPAGQPVTWRDDKSGHGGTVIAAQPYRVGSQDCRPYSHVVNAGGPARSVRGTACRNTDGSWTLLN